MLDFRELLAAPSLLWVRTIGPEFGPEIGWFGRSGSLADLGLSLQLTSPGVTFQTTKIHMKHGRTAS